MTKVEATAKAKVSNVASAAATPTNSRGKHLDVGNIWSSSRQYYESVLIFLFLLLK